LDYISRLRDEWFPTPDAFDIERGVRTSGKRTLFWHRLLPGRSKEISRYQPVDEDLFRRAMCDVWRSQTFVDMGCGKGRALILAHEAGFSKLIGVEFSGSLCRIARANLSHLKIEASVYHQDATRFELPKEPAVLFLYNPFSERIMRLVLSHLGDSRRIVVYVNPLHRNAFGELKQLHAEKDFGIYSN
jgi:SAM-dependent methyltransferase